MSSPRFAPTPGTIADQLRRRLLALDYPAFARCACKLLEALGYEDARPAGRRAWKGYNRPGDWSVARPADVPVPTDSNIHADSIAEAGKEGK